MKNIIAILSTGIVIGFALALANAEEPTYRPLPDQEQNSESSYESSESTEQSQSQSMTLSTTCTDPSGRVYEKGSEGFNECMNKMRTRSEEQKAGQMPYGRETNSMGPGESLGDPADPSDRSGEKAGVAGNNPLDREHSSGG
ncbi:MAG: hypothetical protein A2X97_15015 [Bdellovibrionales bacterium GWA1_52_35]|nr:MAG: hypothetical protein A2X97_15015 [Bdellovibrionales bacterium GWA1_52_35]HCM39804.1 hypothetical protein [Bdellovibrionales bacterium]